MSEGQSPRELKTIDIGGRPPIRRDNGNVDLELEGETRFNAEQNKKRIKDGVKEVQIATKARFDEELVTQVGEGTIIRPFMRDPFATWKNEDPENGIIYAAKLTAQPTPKAEDKYDITGKNLELRIGKRAEGKVAPIADIAVGFGINGYPEHLNLSLPLDVAQLKNTLVRVFDDIYAGRSQFSAPASVRIKASEYPYPDRLLKYEELPHLPFFGRMHDLLSQLDEKSLLYDLLDNNAVYDVNRANGGRAVDLGVAVRFSDIRVDMSEQKGPPLSFVFANGLYITSDIADEPESRKDRIIGDLTGKYPRNKIQRFPDVKSQYHPDANEFSFINLSREKPEEILEPFPTISGDDAMALLDELFQLIPLPQR